MILAPFEYERAESVEQAVDLLGRYGPDAKLLAGGHSLLPHMKRRALSPVVLIDVGRVKELAYVRDDGDTIAIGALTTHNQLAGDPVLSRACGLVSRAASAIGDVQVRNRGTIGGSVAHADPAADLPAALVALDATILVRESAGERRVAAPQFFQGLHVSVLEADEMVTEIRVPNQSGWAWHYEKFVNRSTDWAVVASAVAIRREGGTVADVRVGLANMGGTPLRARGVEAALRGSPDGDQDAFADAAGAASDGTDPPSDLHASATYRRHLARVLTFRAIHHARRAPAAGR